MGVRIVAPRPQVIRMEVIAQDVAEQIAVQTAITAALIVSVPRTNAAHKPQISGAVILQIVGNKG